MSDSLLQFETFTHWEDSRWNSVKNGNFWSYNVTSMLIWRCFNCRVYRSYRTLRYMVRWDGLTDIVHSILGYATISGIRFDVLGHVGLGTFLGYVCLGPLYFRMGPLWDGRQLDRTPDQPNVFKISFGLIVPLKFITIGINVLVSSDSECVNCLF